MINVATDTCCKSIPSMYETPKVMLSVMGMASAMMSARRHSQNPIKDTMTTRTIAS
jgi:hypothetical protein